MLLQLKQLLQPEEIAQARQLLGDDAPWLDGRVSAGSQARTRKCNQQLAQDSPASRPLQALIRQALQREPLFLSAALPRRIFNPLFNRYGGDTNAFGAHVDGAVMHSASTGEWVRSDISCTVFLSDPEDYDGGELCVQDTYGSRGVKLAAGDAVLYPGTSVHEVTPVSAIVSAVSPSWARSLSRFMSRSNSRRLCSSLRTMLSIQKKEARRTPRVTGVTSCTLVPG